MEPIKVKAGSPASHIFFSQRLRLHYVDWGNPEAPTLLLLHGMQDHCRTWDDLIDAFAHDYHIVAPDLRGHGDSEWVRGSAYHYQDYLYDLHQLIQQVELAPVTLVGHSLGGAISALFAGAYPDLVARLILIEGVGLWEAGQPPVPVAQRIRDWVSGTQALAARLPRRYADLEAAYQRMQEANPQLPDRQALHLTVHGSNQNEDGTFSWKYDNYTHSFSPSRFPVDDTVALWKQVSSPVLILNAEAGLPHRIGQDGTDAHFGDLTLHLVQGAGHWTYHDRRDEVVAAMRTFLDG